MASPGSVIGGAIEAALAGLGKLLSGSDASAAAVGAASIAAAAPPESARRRKAFITTEASGPVVRFRRDPSWARRVRPTAAG